MSNLASEKFFSFRFEINFGGWFRLIFLWFFYFQDF